ncbi:hypothetical protein AZ268_gp08 [Acidianus rod-shaped virus 2]|uniref:Uncharacterized protein n=1 Tax=Acidianus rod-shaped virus 2 TaxID=1732175 RepID=A0A0N7FYY0_9VIRU|nr:hypothetical protein AZ268_gp08 [Acidianus rod-shaped virus 2]ALG96876.1 hypothetical protein [Acidianus rod-shaped virus 2]
MSWKLGQRSSELGFSFPNTVNEDLMTTFLNLKIIVTSIIQIFTAFKCNQIIQEVTTPCPEKLRY